MRQSIAWMVGLAGAGLLAAGMAGAGGQAGPSAAASASAGSATVATARARPLGAEAQKALGEFRTMMGHLKCPYREQRRDGFVLGHGACRWSDATECHIAQGASLRWRLVTETGSDGFQGGRDIKLLPGSKDLDGDGWLDVLVTAVRGICFSGGQGTADKPELFVALNHQEGPKLVSPDDRLAGVLGWKGVRWTRWNGRPAIEAVQNQALLPYMMPPVEPPAERFVFVLSQGNKLIPVYKGPAATQVPAAARTRAVPPSKEAAIAKLLEALGKGDHEYLRQAVKFPFPVDMSTSSHEVVRARDPGELVEAWKKAEGTPLGTPCWNGLQVERVTDKSFSGNGYYTCRSPAWNRWIDFEKVDGRWVAVRAGLGGR